MVFIVDQMGSKVSIILILSLLLPTVKAHISFLSVSPANVCDIMPDCLSDSLTDLTRRFDSRLPGGIEETRDGMSAWTLTYVFVLVL